MATFTHYLQGTSDTTIADTDKLQFASGVFDGKIKVGEYNESTHIKDDANADKSSGNTPKNNKYISSTEISIDGGASESLSGIAEADCALKINISDASSVSVESAIIYAYDGSTTTNAMAGTTVQMAEQGDSNWTEAGGSGSALSLTDQASATSHDYFIAISATPTSIGTKTGKYRMELTYY